MSRPLSPLAPPPTGSGLPPSTPPPDALPDLVRDYLAHIKHARGLSSTTCLHYQAWLRLFLKWLAEEKHPLTLSSFSTPTLRAYLYASSRAGKRPRTILSAFNPIRGMAAYLVEIGLLPYDPTKGLTFPKKDAAERVTVSTEEVAALLTAVERLPDAAEVPQARALLYTLVFSGIRFDELRSLRVPTSALTPERFWWHTARAKKSRLLYPPADCLDALGKWLTERARRFPACQHDYLWAYNCALRVSEQYIRDLLEAVKSIAGLREHDNIKPHALRHAFATRMKDNGAAITAIKAALGHSQLSTTFQYLHMGEHEAKQMAQYATLATSVPAPPDVQSKPTAPAPRAAAPARPTAARTAPQTPCHAARRDAPRNDPHRRRLTRATR